MLNPKTLAFTLTLAFSVTYSPTKKTLCMETSPNLFSLWEVDKMNMRVQFENDSSRKITSTDFSEDCEGILIPNQTKQTCFHVTFINQLVGFCNNSPENS